MSPTSSQKHNCPDILLLPRTFLMEGPKTPDNSLFEKRNSTVLKNLFFLYGKSRPRE